MKNSFLIFSLFFISTNIFANEVNVYSYRKPHLVQPLFNQFEKDTNIKVNTIFAEKGIVQRLKNEGKNSPADLIFTVDIGRLNDLKMNNLLQIVNSNTLKKNIPDFLRDKDSKWFGLTSRARVIVISKKSKKIVKNYQDLADPEFKGKVCIRSAKHPYMVGLFSSLLFHLGETQLKNYLTDLKSNLVRKPQGNDRAQVKAIYSGLCEVSVINHYYLALMLNDKEQKKWADSVNVIFPNQSTFGTHMNISGVALAKNSPNKNNAIMLMEFLSSPTGQALYSISNDEYPVNSKIELSATLVSWGNFNKDKTSLSKIASLRKTVIKIIDDLSINN
jgi:iron(III) transport system substrate-binding protein